MNSVDRLHILQRLRAIDEIPMTDLGRAEAEVCVLVMELTGADLAAVMLAQRDPALPDDDPLRGWRLLKLIPADDDPRVEAMLNRARRDESYVEDPHSQALTRGMGAHRALLRHDAVSPEQWRDSPNRGLLESAGIHDQLYGIHVIDDRNELFIPVSRTTLDNPFDDGDKARLLEVVTHLRRIGRRIALFHGLLARAILTVREQEALRWLLNGLSEKEMAHEMGVGTRTVHSHVTALYRKFAVNSRAELTALWLMA